jgi:hypothetical protein
MDLTYDELLVTQRRWEVPIECHSEVFRVVPLVSDNVFEQCGLVDHNLCKSPAAMQLA